MGAAFLFVLTLWITRLPAQLPICPFAHILDTLEAEETENGEASEN